MGCPWCGTWLDSCNCDEECVCGSAYGDCSPDGEPCAVSMEWDRRTVELMKECVQDMQAEAMARDMAVGG